MIKNKRGFLLAEETLKIVIAVIAIAFLIYFLTSLYFAKVNGDKKLQADNLIETLKPKLNNLSEGSVDNIDVFNPKGWYIFSYISSNVGPNACAGNNCICICDNAWDLDGRFNRQQKECDKDGVCYIRYDFGAFDPISITGDLKIINIVKSGGKIYFQG